MSTGWQGRHTLWQGGVRGVPNAPQWGTRPPQMAAPMISTAATSTLACSASPRTVTSMAVDSSSVGAGTRHASHQLEARQRQRDEAAGETAGERRQAGEQKRGHVGQRHAQRCQRAPQRNGGQCQAVGVQVGFHAAQLNRHGGALHPTRSRPATLPCVAGVEAHKPCTHNVCVSCQGLNNITLSIDEQVAWRARESAQKMGKSLNQVVRDHLEQLAGSAQRGQQWAQFEARCLQSGAKVGDGRFDRDEANAR